MFLNEGKVMETKKTGRSAAAVAAQFRNSAGSMKDKRAPRGGSRNESRDFMDEVTEDREIAMEVARAGEPEPSLNDLDLNAQAELTDREDEEPFQGDDTWMDDIGDGYDDWMDY